MNLGKLWRNYSLSIVLAVIFALTWGSMAVFEWQKFVQDETEHNQTVDVSNFWPIFGEATLQNWQSEFLQLLAMVILTKYFIHQGSHESKDSTEEMQVSLKKIEKKLGIK